MSAQPIPYSKLINGFVMMARELDDNDVADDIDSLCSAFEALLLNARLMAAAVPDTLRLTGFANGFALMTWKTLAWDDSALNTVPRPISLAEQARLSEHLGRVLSAILPDDGSGLYHHLETEDGLICALYRVDDETAIRAAASAAHVIEQAMRWP